MSELVADCPRCHAKRMTFDLVSQHYLSSFLGLSRYEAFCICRDCSKTTTFLLLQRFEQHDDVLNQTPLSKLSGTVNKYMEIHSHVTPKDMAALEPPKHLPEAMEAAFREAATCVAVKCPNAAGTMFRLCVDLATRPLLPAKDAPAPNTRIRRNLGLRLPWLFDNNLLPENLRELSACIQQDGNDGAHEGTLTMVEAEDLSDFAFALLEGLYTEQAKLGIAKERRKKRRESKD